MLNLDYIAGKYAPMILNVSDNKQKKNIESYVNKALGILAEQGAFALLLWARGNTAGPQKPKKIGDVILDTARILLEKELELSRVLSGQDPLQSFNDGVCKNFATLMMVQQVLERVLTYARHYAKTA